MNLKFFNSKVGKLEIIIFVSGAVVMILELIGSRILAPYLGTSIFVWSALIGIILGALSLGYYLGGRLSKNNPHLAFLTTILLLAGLSILLLTIIKTPVLEIAMSLGIKIGSVVATLGLFALPSVILGMVSPYAIRLKIKNIEQSGGVAGNLYALSTVGSIVGTFLAGFYLIPTFGSQHILFGLSLILILTSLLGGKKFFTTMFLIFVLISWAALGSKLTLYVYEADSAYNHIIVNDQVDQTGQPTRGLYLATELHSVIYKNSDELASFYHRIYQLDNLFKPDIKTGLSLGGGAYISPLKFLQKYPQAEMTVVEIDPKVTAVAKNFFGLNPNLRLSIKHEDARIFLNNNSKKYDVIYGDAFASYYAIPFQLTTSEAIKEIYSQLNDDGVFIINIISGLTGEKSTFLQAQYLSIPRAYLS